MRSFATTGVAILMAAAVASSTTAPVAELVASYSLAEIGLFFSVV
jgi:hypothetical protein